MTIARRTSIAIVGGGIGGLTVAASLLRAGFDVHVYEQASALGEVGAGINIGPNASRVLHRLGIAEALGRTCVKLCLTSGAGMMDVFCSAPRWGKRSRPLSAHRSILFIVAFCTRISGCDPSRPLSPNGCSPTLAPKMALFTSASVAVDVLPSRFHTILIVSGQMQFVFFVGVVVRRKCIGHRHT